MKKHVLTAAALICVLATLSLCSCTNAGTPTTGSPTETAAPETTASAINTSGTETAVPTEQSTPVPTENTGAAGTETGTADAVVYDIRLSDSGVDLGESGAALEGKVIKITKAGSYRFTGALSDGEIVVAVSKEETVDLILAGVSITNKDGPAIWCDSADKLYVTTEENTVNTLSDGKNYALPDGPNATLYSDDDLTVRGTGTLTVMGRFKNGISSKNDIKIKELTLNVESYNTGVRGKGSVTVTSGNIEINAGNDGIKSTDDTTKGKGFVEITGGKIVITAGDDGIQAATVLTVSGGSVQINAEGKKVNAPEQNITEGTVR
ncbi:MAG: carbohydrate-binding domain-containing protein [Clostridia bacterium]|nr:carbohydrate-binding domain-containing protein [Clostridia bacterium]